MSIRRCGSKQCGRRGESQARAAEIALVALDRPMDKFLDYGLWLTCRELEPYWMAALQEGKFDYGGNPRRLLFCFRRPAIRRPCHRW